MSDVARLNSISPSALPAARRHVLRNRLWKAGIAAAAVLAVLITFDITGRLRDPSHKLALGHDLLPSYAAGIIVRQGTPRLMYDRWAMAAVELRIIRQADLDIDGRYGPWLNPPVYAWVFVPLSMLPYRQAAALFLVINLVLMTLSLILLTRLLQREASPIKSSRHSGIRPAIDALPHEPDIASATPRSRGLSARATIESAPAIHAPRPSPALRLTWRNTALVPLIVLLPLPFWQAMGHQQNTFISFFILVCMVTLWRKERAFIAGGVAGLLFFKPQLAAVLAGLLVLDLGWRALAGLTVTGVLLLGITLVATPGCLTEFVRRLPPILHWLQIESPYNWGRQVTFQSFWRLLIQGHVRAETALAVKVPWVFSSAVFIVGLGLAWRRHRRGTSRLFSRDRLIAAGIVSMPLLMPYYMDYDLLLLAIPPVLLAAEWVRRPENINRWDYSLLATWALFCIESHVNPGLAGHSRINAAVPLLATLAALHIGRCLRQYPQSVIESMPNRHIFPPPPARFRSFLRIDPVACRG